MNYELFDDDVKKKNVSYCPQLYLCRRYQELSTYDYEKYTVWQKLSVT